MHSRSPAVSSDYFTDLARCFGEMGLKEDFVAAAKLFYALEHLRAASVGSVAEKGWTDAAGLVGEVRQKGFRAPLEICRIRQVRRGETQDTLAHDGANP